MFTSCVFHLKRTSVWFKTRLTVRTLSFLPVGPRCSVCWTGGPAHSDVTEGRAQVVYAAGCRQAGRGWRRRDDHAPCCTCTHHACTHLRAEERQFGLKRASKSNCIAKLLWHFITFYSAYTYINFTLTLPLAFIVCNSTVISTFIRNYSLDSSTAFNLKGFNLKLKFLDAFSCLKL